MTKTYLKDLKPDEVIRRLKAGEVLKDKDSKTIVKIVDGFICAFRSNGEFTINDGVFSDCDTRELQYFETPDELKLEVGKCYKTRDGRKAFVSYYDKNKNEYLGCIQDEDVVVYWCENGLWYENEESNEDLVSEWSDDDVAED